MDIDHIRFAWMCGEPMKEVKIAISQSTRMRESIDGIRNHIMLMDAGEELAQYCMTLEARSPEEWLFFLRQAVNHLQKVVAPHEPQVRRIRTHTSD